jgi:hypothetical protein
VNGDLVQSHFDRQPEERRTLATTSVIDTGEPLRAWQRAMFWAWAAAALPVNGDRGMALELPKDFEEMGVQTFCARPVDGPLAQLRRLHQAQAVHQPRRSPQRHDCAPVSVTMMRACAAIAMLIYLLTALLLRAVRG